MIKIEDGCVATMRALEQLFDSQGKKGRAKVTIQGLSDFLASVENQRLSLGDKRIIVDQAIVMIENFYAHLPFKRTRYAIDPVQRLRLLRARIGEFPDELSFHTEVIEAFAEMRDPHTFYQMPVPLKGAMAFLPFFVEAHVDKDGKRNRRGFTVTRILPGFDHEFFRPGVEIIYWNGAPVDVAVRRLAQRIPGGNAPAKFVRGLMRLTVRSLSFNLPPDEEKVYVQYKFFNDRTKQDEERVFIVPWSVGSGLAPDIFNSRKGGVAVCEPLADLASIKGRLWKNIGPGPSTLQASKALPDVFEFEHSIDPSSDYVTATNGRRGADKRFGRIRIRTFGADPDAMFDEFLSILKIMKEKAPDGLIVDVRSNPGGSITGAERLLQLLTPKDITPAKFQFANTVAVQCVLAKVKALRRSHSDLFDKLIETVVEFRDWLLQDTEEAIAGGSLLTEAHTLTPYEDANDTGQVYQAPVVLLIDAGSYSATDIFSAGFQDHGIGLVIGVDENTGGGGASRWLHRQELVKRLKDLPGLGLPLQSLPGNAAMGVAIQRSSRVGPNAGQALEDLGVKRDIEYRITRADLLGGNSEMVRFACNILGKQLVYKLEVSRKKLTPQGVNVTVRTRNLERLVCCLDDHPQLVVNNSFQNVTAPTEFTVPLHGYERGKPPEELTIKGYAWRSRKTPDGMEKVFELVASVKTAVADET